MKKKDNLGCKGHPIVKILMLMKVYFIISMIFCINISASVYSQNTKMTFNKNNVSVQEILDEIEQNTEFRFFLQHEKIKTDRKLNLNVTDATVEEILEKVFNDQRVEYNISDKNLILISAKNQNSVQQQEKIAIAGKVVDTNGESLPGVSVMEKGTSNGVTTDAEGNYSISLKSGDVTLVFSFVGMRSQEVAVAGRKVINVTLQSDMSELDEIVVVGYGTQKVENLTGSVSSVKADVLESRSVKNVGEALKGIVPGLNISKSSGSPDANPSFNIRGFTGFNNDGAQAEGPLVLVDGVAQNINDINPEDVESISVLKDAAASAIYGSRAPFGVILVTTKSGKEGKMKINFSSNISFSEIVGVPETVNSVRFAEAWNEAFRNSRDKDYFSAETIQRMKDYQSGKNKNSNVLDASGLWGTWDLANGNSDWMNEVFKKWQTNQKHTVSISGGLPNGKLNYYASFGSTENGGMLKHPYSKDEYVRYNTIVKLSSQITPWLKIGVDNKMSNVTVERPTTGDGTIMNSIGRVWPNIPTHNPDSIMHIINPNTRISKNGFYKNQIDDIFLTGKFDITPLKGLLIHGNYTYNNYSRRHYRHDTKYDIPNPNETTTTGGSNPSQVTEEYNKDTYKQTELFVSYDKTLFGHYAKVLAGYQQEEKDYSKLWGYKKDLITESVPSISTAKGTSDIDDAIGHWSTQGYFFRFNYNYKEKYLFEFNGRYDASSKFPSDTRWAFFPSFSVGYNISKEDFWKVKEVSMFKLRGSYGTLGNQNVANYLYLPNMKYNASTGHMIGGTKASNIEMPGIISPEITWTKPHVLDFGFDILALDNRLSVKYDWYQRTIYDLLGPAQQMPQSLGTSAPKENNAVSETRGWDLEISWKDRVEKVLGHDLTYNVGFTLSDYIGYVVKYENKTGSIGGVWTKGERFGTIYGYETVKVAQSEKDFLDGVSQHRIHNDYWYPGDIVYKDQDGDGKIDSGNSDYFNKGDLIELGNSSPRFIFGLNLGVNWNNFDINARFEGVGKQDIVMGSYYFWGFDGSMWHSSVFQHTTDYWTPTNTGAYYPRPYMGGEVNKNHKTQSRYVMNGAYMRFQTLQLGYSIPKPILEKIKFTKARIYASIENVGMVFNMAELDNLDPMLLRNGNGQIYPPQRTFSFGLNVSF